MTNITLRTAIAALLATGTWAAPALSADNAATGGGLEEIVVTATRREEKLMDVPMSLQAFSQEKLDQQGLRSIDDLTRVAPGVTFIRNGMGSASNYNDENSDVSIRGIDSSAGAATTGVYIDDTPIQTRHLNFGTVSPYPALFDLERVEVLKGPQGTLFGAGSEGGTLRFITPEPGLHEYSGYVRGEFGAIANGGENYEAGAAVGGPIIDGVLGFRVSASYRQDGGWVNRVSVTPPPSTVDAATGATLYTGTPTITGVTEKNANWRDTATFRAALKWQPSENLSVTPSIYVQSLHINDTGAYWQNISDPAGNHYNNGNALRNPSTDPFWLAGLKVNWHAAWADVTSNTSFFSRSQHSVSDYTQWFDTVFFFDQYGQAGGQNYALFSDKQNNFNQEFRLSSIDPNARIQWNAGVFYTHTYENSTEYIVSPAGAAGLPNNYVYLQPRFSMLDEQVAVFGEVNWKITDTVKLTTGLRYSHLNYSGVVNEVEQGLFGSLNVNTPSSGAEKPVTPRIVLNYQPDKDSLYYVSAAKGFRPGGINTQLPQTCMPPGLDAATAAQPFGPDSLWQYEVGSKNTLLDHHLTVSAAAYYIKWKNIQQFVYLSCGLGFNYNLGEVTSKGADIELSWRANDALTLGLTAAYTRAAYEQPVTLGVSTPADQLVAAGNQLPSAPWNLNLNAEYVWTTVAHRPYVRVDYQFSTAQTGLVPYQDPANIPNADPTLPGLPEIKVLNLRAGVKFAGYDLSAFVTNATNFHSPIFVSRDFAATNYGLPNLNDNYFARGYAPRTIGVTATYRF